MKSMTAYAQKSIELPQGSLTWVIRSVNHRYLDCQLRLPDDFRHLENPLRQKIKDRLSRGKVEANLHFNPDSTQIARLMSLNSDMAMQLKMMLKQLEDELDHVKVDTSRLLLWPGLVDHQQMDLSPVYEAALTLFDDTLDSFIEVRTAEGKAVYALLVKRLDGMNQELNALSKHAPRLREHLKTKIQSRLADLEVEVDDGRLEQEVAILIQKADVDEELDRLNVHINEFRRIIETDQACGRRLDFLIQELNREANTLGSKATLLETSQSSVELKVLIEQLREQIQNIE